MAQCGSDRSRRRLQPHRSEVRSRAVLDVPLHLLLADHRCPVCRPLCRGLALSRMADSVAPTPAIERPAKRRQKPGRLAAARLATRHASQEARGRALTRSYGGPNLGLWLAGLGGATTRPRECGRPWAGRRRTSTAVARVADAAPGPTPS